jgi:hypothetical protein
VLYVVSTTDQLTWRHEATFDLDTDLREPRFLAVGGRLLLYVAVLGKNFAAFEPQGTFVSELPAVRLHVTARRFRPIVVRSAAGADADSPDDAHALTFIPTLSSGV